MLDVCVGQFPSKSLRGGLYSEGRFNGGFFALRAWGAYIWRGSDMEGLVFGILRYFITKCDSFFFTKCDKCHYKVRQFYYKVRRLLQSATEHSMNGLLTYLSRTCILHIFHGHLQCRKIVIPHQASYGFS